MPQQSQKQKRDPLKAPEQPLSSETTAPSAETGAVRRRSRSYGQGESASPAPQVPSGLTDGGGGDSYWSAMKDWYENAYAQALRENREAAEQAAARAGEDARRQGEALRGEYGQLDRQLYRDYMEQRRTLPQELAARGYTGGMSETARLRLHSGYEENLAANRRELAARESELEYRRALAEEKARTQAGENDAKARRSLEQSLLSLEKERRSQTQSEDLRRAKALAAAGDFSGYRALGWSEEEIAYLTAMWAARNPKLQYVQSYGHYS